MESFVINSIIIDIVNNLIPYEESREWILSSTSINDLMERAAGFPVEIEFRILEQLSSINPKDRFQNECLEPQIEQFWLGHILSSSGTPKISSDRFFPSSNLQSLKEIISGFKLWTIEGDECIFKGNSYKILDLIGMCDCFSRNGKPWLMCPFKEIRLAYILLDNFYNSIEDRFYANEITKKLKKFQIHSSNLLKYIDSSISFEFDEDLCSNLLQIVQKNAQIIHSSRVLPDINVPSSWETVIGDALFEQMALPMAQRASYNMSYSKVYGRMGGDPESAFDDYSLPDMMFTTGKNDPMFYPHVGCHSHLAKKRNQAFIEASINKFVALYLIDKEFSEVEDDVVSVLSDLISNEINQICSIANDIHHQKNQSIHESLLCMLKLNSDFGK